MKEVERLEYKLQNSIIAPKLELTNYSPQNQITATLDWKEGVLRLKKTIYWTMRMIKMQLTEKPLTSQE